MTISFKDRLDSDGGPYTEPELIKAGKFLMQIRKDTDAVNSTLSKFNTSEGNIFDDTLQISTRYLDEAIELVQTRLGEMMLELQEKKK